MNRILIVDDEKSVRFVMAQVLRKNGHEVVEASGGTEAVQILKKNKLDLILLDMIMPDMDGLQALQELKQINPDIPIIIITGHGDIPNAVEATKLGAYDFLEKPPPLNRLLVTIQRAIERFELQRSVDQLDKSVEASLEWIFGKSIAIKTVIQQIRQVALSNFLVVIQGETGTGKSVVAQAIHNLSRRTEQPFQVIDVGAIPETLIESELFGHEKGAFTGADRKKKGYFESAQGGTIFIDELENLPLGMQGKLLRAVEDRRAYPLGSTSPVAFDARVIAATNMDLRQMVIEKKFREDLFYRLSEFIISLPPLRERVEDIPFFAAKFLMKASTELNRQIGELDQKTLNLLSSYSWPGNIRELKNVIRRAALLAENGVIKPEHFQSLLRDSHGHSATGAVMPLKQVSAMAAREAEREAIKRVLAMTHGNKSKAASILEIDYKTLLTKIKEYL
jgi:DNA-binding NtrC family response regulator